MPAIQEAIIVDNKDRSFANYYNDAVSYHSSAQGYLPGAYMHELKQFKNRLPEKVNRMRSELFKHVGKIIYKVVLGKKLSEEENSIYQRRKKDVFISDCIKIYNKYNISIKTDAETLTREYEPGNFVEDEALTIFRASSWDYKMASKIYSDLYEIVDPTLDKRNVSIRNARPWGKGL